MICYSVKANSNLGILKVMNDAGSSFDVVSGGELYRVKQAGADTSKVVFAGVGKTDVGRTLATVLKTELIRLQCYEGLDVTAAVYEWDYPRQMLEIRLAEASGAVDREALAGSLYGDRFLLRRPLLDAIDNDDAVPPVLLARATEIID